MYSVILTELGIGVFENEKCLKAFPFSDPVNNYILIKEGKAKVSELVHYLSEIETGIEINNNSLYSILKRNSIDTQLMSNEDLKKIQTSKPKFLIEAGFAQDSSDVMTKLRDFAIQLSSSKVSEISERPDLHTIQSINSLDEIDRIINGISSRLREWYGLHFPELDNVIDSILGYSQIILAGKRENLSEKVYEHAGFPNSKVEMLSVIAKKSKGGDISQENLEIVQLLAKQLIELNNLRKKLEEHIHTQMAQVAPNLAAVLGTAVGARILARAGSLKKLATMPASTIQVLGAEKALFRSLKTGSQPPKHGLLFQHAMVHAAPKWQRGKIARTVAAKAAIASRVDVYGGELNTTLLKKLNIRVEEINEKYKIPIPESKKNEKSKKDFHSKKDLRSKSDFKPKGKKKKPKMKAKKRKKFGRK